jgi:hypothetical protein
LSSRGPQKLQERTFDASAAMTRPTGASGRAGHRSTLSGK